MQHSQTAPTQGSDKWGPRQGKGSEPCSWPGQHTVLPHLQLLSAGTAHCSRPSCTSWEMGR